MSERNRPRFIIGVTLGYAVLATLWIVFSDRLLAGIADPAAMTALETVKGIAFVLVTATGLAVALRHVPLPAAESAGPGMQAPARSWPLIVIFALAALVITAIGFTAYHAGFQALRRQEFAELKAVAALKVTTISRWLDERRANARALSGDPAVVSALTTWLATDAAADRAAIYGTMANLRSTYRLSAAQIVDADGHVLLQDGQPTLNGARLQRAIAAALATESPVLVDLYRPEAAPGIRIAFVAPMDVPRGAPGTARLFITLELRPEAYLFPVLQSWPFSDSTGEAVLVRQESGAVVFLNNLRFRADGALRLRLPLSSQSLPAAMLLRGEASEVDGEDYRGVPVLAAGLPVPGTPWLLFAKVDVSEAYGAIGRLAALTGGLTAGALATAAALAGLFWQRQRLRAALIDVAQRRRTAAAQLRFRATFDQAATGIAHLAIDGTWLRANQRLCEMLGYSLAELQAADLQGPNEPDHPAVDLGRRRALLEGEIASYREERLQRRRDGSTIWMDVTVSLVRGADGGPEFLLLVALDITERRRADEQIRQAAAVFSNTHEGVIITDPESRIIRVNPAVCTITGYSEQELCGNNVRMLQSGRHDKEFYRNLWTSIQSDGFWQGEIWNRRKNGEIYPELTTISTVRDAAGQVSNYVATFTDITHLKQSQTQLEQLAHYDPLTGLPNRLLLVSRLDHAVGRMRRHDGIGAVLFLDLDRFKNVNDSLGHRVGDELLEAVAGRLQLRLRDSDTLARLGGDEFVVVLEDLTSPERAAGVAQSLIERLAEPFQLSGSQEVYIGASIGISMFPADSQAAPELIQQADTALYAAKEGGKGTYRFYRAELTEAANARLDLEARLRRGLDRGEMVLYYQPLVSVATQRVVGVEALLRWQDPARGLVMPDRFIALAEETGLIVPLGDWVLREACRQLQAWRAAGVMVESVAVNLSPRQFQLLDIHERVRDVLKESGLPSQCLELEITEGALMHHGEATLEKLDALKRLGVRLAIDDFGTGYSSLAYLKRFPIDKLKIDKSFIREIPGNAADVEISGAIIGLAKNLHLEVLAEGVETAAQLEFLQHRGCETAQGYLFARPLPPAELARFVSERQAPVCVAEFGAAVS